MSHPLSLNITAIFSSRGQVVIPKILREKLGIHAGSELVFKIQKNGSVEIKQQERSIEMFLGCCKYPDEKPMSIKDMDIAIMRVVNEEN